MHDELLLSGVSEDVRKEALAAFLQKKKIWERDGGAPPRLDFEISVARDRLKEESNNVNEENLAEEAGDVNRGEPAVVEGRRERAARFAAAFDKRFGR